MGAQFFQDLSRGVLGALRGVGIAGTDAFSMIAFCVILPTASHGAGRSPPVAEGGSVAEDDIAGTGIRVGGWLPTPDQPADAPERPVGPRRLPGDTQPSVPGRRSRRTGNARRPTRTSRRPRGIWKRPVHLRRLRSRRARSRRAGSRRAGSLAAPRRQSVPSPVRARPAAGFRWSGRPRSDCTCPLRRRSGRAPPTSRPTRPASDRCTGQTRRRDRAGTPPRRASRRACPAVWPT